MDNKASIYDGLVTYENDQKVPSAKYIEDVEKLVGDKDPVIVGNSAKELLAKYRFMEKTMATKLASLNNKIPELKDAITILEKIENKKQSDDSAIQTYFKVSDTLYSEAHIASTESVFLWLGANTMVEYPLKEATDLLKSQMQIALDGINDITRDMEWLRKQITSMEVTVARLHNFAVMKKSTAATAPS